VEGGHTYDQVFDAENRLISITENGHTTQFVYDGNGNMVKKINPDGSRTIYVAGNYEVRKDSGGTVIGSTTYYPAAGAMRVVTGTNVAVYYTLGDQLGSTSVVTDASGAVMGTQGYFPFGETRYKTGNLNPLQGVQLPTGFTPGSRKSAGWGCIITRRGFTRPGWAGSSRRIRLRREGRRG
jgi:YD repeat-containing protein